MAADGNALGTRLRQILQQGADLCTATAGAQQLEELLVLQHVLGMVGALAQFPEGAVVLGGATESAGEAALADAVSRVWAAAGSDEANSPAAEVGRAAADAVLQPGIDMQFLCFCFNA